MVLSAPKRSIHATNSAGNTFMHDACVFFCPMLVLFLRMTLTSSLPFVTHIRGHMARTPLPSPLPCLPSFYSPKKKGSELGFLPWRPLASNWCAFLRPTSIIRSTQDARRFLRSVRILMLLFQALILTRTNTYISYNVLVVVFFCNTCHIVSTSCDILRIAWYRYRDI